MSYAHAVPPEGQPALTPDAGTFQVTVASSHANHATVYLKGSVDLATSELLADVLNQQLGTGRRFVRLDLSGLLFLDCAGLRTLVHAHNAFLAARGTLVLTGIRPHIARLLQISHLDEALLIADGPGRPSHRHSGPRSSLVAHR
jgi:anti-sigma B factor antagonist